MPDELGPWNPGIRSRIPTAYLPLATAFSTANVLTSLDEAQERSAFTGLEPEDLIAFRPERLVVHELLIRVMADISVPDGQEYADLGVNFRAVAESIQHGHIEPQMAGIVRAWHELRERAADAIGNELKTSLFAPAERPHETSRGGVLGLLGFGRKPAAALAETIEDKEARIIAAWQQRAAASDDPLLACALRTLARLAVAIGVQHGRVRGDPALLTALATDHRDGRPDLGAGLAVPRGRAVVAGRGAGRPATA
jgi:hypothetical protein